MRRAPFLVVCVALAMAVAAPFVVQALVNYPPAALLQPGDITGTMIRTGTITDTNVSATADIWVNKIKFGGLQGMVPFLNGTYVATSTNFVFATSTNTLTLVGGTIAATSTSFGGVNMTWPVNAGTSGQALTTDGSGAYSYTNITPTSITTSLYALNTLAARQAVYAYSSTSPAFITTPTIVVQAGFGISAAQLKAAAMMNITATTTYTTIGVGVSVHNSPTDNVLISVQSAPSDVPTGNAIRSITEAHTVFTASCPAAYQTFAATSSFTLNPGVYAVVEERTGSADATNYYNTCGASSGGDSANNNGYLLESGTWTANGTEIFDGEVFALIDGVDLASWDATSTSHAVGFSTGSYTTGQMANIEVAGLLGGFSGLTTGSKYYVGDTAGTISTTVGFATSSIGRAVSTTTLLVLPN